MVLGVGHGGCEGAEIDGLAGGLGDEQLVSDGFELVARACCGDLSSEDADEG